MLLWLLILFLLPTPLFATNFSIGQSLVYTVSQTGQATVSQEISLTNKTADYYVERYQIKISSTEIKNITARDQSGSIIESVSKDSTATIINLKFNQPALGLGQKTDFEISYSLPDFARNKGNTWEIVLPQFKADSDTSIHAKLVIPKSFGKVAFSSLPINQLSSTATSTIVNLTNQQLTTKTILLVFGDYQLFDFKLIYFLNNPSSETIRTEIAIPPHTDSQHIVYQQIDPLPENIYSDPDGNWLAKYILSPNQNLKVTATGQAKIFPSQQRQPPSSSSYLSPQPYWPTDDPQIAQIASLQTTPRQIYDYVVNTLQYDYSRVDNPNRLGATAALANPANSLCTEFADLFVTLARAAQIPAREVEGYAHSLDSRLKPTNPQGDILHAWAQYHDSQTNSWISVDPTWANTTNGIDYFTNLDLNHLAFVFHGQSSDYPPPPGSYKKDQNEKTVYVNLSQQPLSPQYQPPNVKPQPFYPPLSSPLITIRNPNPNLLANLQIASSDWSDTFQLPPFSSQQTAIPPQPFFQSLLPQNRYLRFTIIHDHQPDPLLITIRNPSHYQNLLLVGACLILILSLVGLILAGSKNHEKNS